MTIKTKRSIGEVPFHLDRLLQRYALIYKEDPCICVRIWGSIQDRNKNRDGRFPIGSNRPLETCFSPSWNDALFHPYDVDERKVVL